MRHKISFADLKTKRVGVWGVGVEGRASIERLRALDIEPVLVDEKLTELDGLPVFDKASGGIDLLAGCDVVIKSPGISRYAPDAVRLEEAGVAITGGIGLWMQEVDRSRVMCVTGTKGKSTTVSIAGHLLEGFGKKVFVGGNIGKVPFALEAQDAYDYWVIEVSSHQATDLASGPAVAGITSLGSDHVDWHGSDEQYIADKLSLCTLDPTTVTVANATSPIVQEHAAQLGTNIDWARKADAEAKWIDALRLQGEHNRMNAAIARKCLEALGISVTEEEWAEAAAGFAGLSHRLSPVGSIGNVAFVDDGLATNVLPVIAALDAFPDERVALLAGGYDRGIDYSPLGTHVAQRKVPTALVAMPDSGARIVEALRKHEHPNVEVIEASSLDDAVVKAFEWANPKGVVLLSPASASFNAFGGYAQRSAAFVAAFEALRASST